MWQIIWHQTLLSTFNILKVRLRGSLGASLDEWSLNVLLIAFLRVYKVIGRQKSIAIRSKERIAKYVQRQIYLHAKLEELYIFLIIRADIFAADCITSARERRSGAQKLFDTNKNIH